MNKGLRYKLETHELSLTDTIDLDNKRFLKPFKTRHTPRRSLIWLSNIGKEKKD